MANAPTAAGPRSRALAADPIHGGVLVWSDAARTVAELNLSSLNLSAPTPTLAPEPGAVAYDAADGRLFAADAALPGVESMMPFAGSTTSTTPLPAPPSSVVVAPNGSWVYAALPGEVVAIAAATGALVGSAALNGTNGPLVVDPTSGLVWVGRPDLAMWIGVNLSTLAVGPTAQARPGLDAGLPDLATLVPGSDRIAVLNLSSPGTAIEFNASTGRTVGVVTGLGANATALAYDSADALVYAAGDTLSAFDPVQSVVDVRGAPLGPHASVAAMTFDPAVARILVRTIGPSGAGTVASVDGASPRGANGSLLLAPVGLGNGSLVAGLPGSSSALAGAGLLLTANSFSGTVSVLGSPPTVASFAFAPASVDLGGTTVGAVAAAGGAGPLTASYSGLPSGCGSSSSLALLCSPTATGTYNVTVRLTDALGDAGSGRAPLVVAGALTVLAAPVGPAGGAVDVGVALTFDATAGGGSPPYRYSWTFGDGATGTGASPRHTYAAAGSVVATVLVQDTGGGVGAASVAVQVVPLPTIAIAAGPAGWSADNGSVSNLSATIVGGVGPGTVAWQFSDGGPMASGASVVHTWHHAGLVAVTATFTDAWGVTNRTSATMRVYSALAASVSTDPNSTSFGPSSSVTFAARPSGGSGSYSYFWAFGDGTSAVGPSVVHTFGRTGNYTVELTVTDSVGGSYATAIRVTVASLAPAAPDWLGTGAGPALVLGLVVGATLAAVVLFAAERSKHRRPVRPPEPFEPPAGPRER